MPVLLASLTGPVVNLATHVIGRLGYAGVALMCATSGVIGLPGTEPTMLFAGFNVYQGHLTLVGVIIAGIAHAATQQYINLAHFGGRPMTTYRATPRLMRRG